MSVSRYHCGRCTGESTAILRPRRRRPATAPCAFARLRPLGRRAGQDKERTRTRGAVEGSRPRWPRSLRASASPRGSVSPSAPFPQALRLPALGETSRGPLERSLAAPSARPGPPFRPSADGGRAISPVPRRRPRVIPTRIALCNAETRIPPGDADSDPSAFALPWGKKRYGREK